MVTRGNGVRGGFGQISKANQNIQNLIDSVRNDVENVTGRLNKYEAVVFSRQIVRGENFKVKVDIGKNNYLHVAVHVQLGEGAKAARLSSCVVGKSLEDPL